MQNDVVINLEGKPTGYVQHFNNFINTYYLESDISGVKTKVIRNSSSSDLICRFCLKQKSQTSFKNIAHVFPQLMGRSRLKSNFECDKCNSLFSKYEGCLGHYLLINRSLLGQRKKKSGLPKFKSKSGMSIQSKLDLNREKYPDDVRLIGNELLQKNGRIVQINEGGDLNSLTIENGILSFNVKRHPYKEINVYKSILKIGLSILDFQEMRKYTYLLGVLSSDDSIPEEIEYSNTFIFLSIGTVPIIHDIFDMPVARVYRNKSSNSFFERVFVLYYGNTIFEFPLISDKEILRLRSTQDQISWMSVPTYKNPLLCNEMFKNEKLLKALDSTTYENFPCFSSKLKKNDEVKYEFPIVDLQK